MEENTEVSLEASEPLAYLRYGFVFSLIALVLTTIYFVSIVSHQPDRTWGVLLAASLPSWRCGLIMRRRAWGQLGRGDAAFALAAGGFVVCFLAFPLSVLFDSYSFRSFLGFPAVYFWFPLVLFVPWGCYTFLECRALKWPSNDWGIGLKHSRITSLAGIVAWALAYVGTCFFLIVANMYRRGYWHYYESTLLELFLNSAFLCAAPFLMASCTLATRALGRHKS